MTITNYTADKVSSASPSVDINVRSYRCHLAIIRDEDGYSAVVLNLPGTGGCGETEEEAIESAKGSLRVAVDCYGLDSIPWITDYDIPEGSYTKWIMVDA